LGFFYDSNKYPTVKELTKILENIPEIQDRRIEDIEFNLEACILKFDKTGKEFAEVNYNAGNVVLHLKGDWK
jgi:hypothetical protein